MKGDSSVSELKGKSRQNMPSGVPRCATSTQSRVRFPVSRPWGDKACASISTSRFSLRGSVSKLTIFHNRSRSGFDSQTPHCPQHVGHQRHTERTHAHIPPLGLRLGSAEHHMRRSGTARAKTGSGPSGQSGTDLVRRRRACGGPGFKSQQAPWELFAPTRSSSLSFRMARVVQVMG